MSALSPVSPCQAGEASASRELTRITTENGLTKEWMGIKFLLITKLAYLPKAFYQIHSNFYLWQSYYYLFYGVKIRHT